MKLYTSTPISRILSRPFSKAGKRIFERSGTDMNEVRRLGHGMKEVGAGYGFPEISRLGSVIEEAASTGDAPRIEEAIGMLADYLSVVEVRIESK